MGEHTTVTVYEAAGKTVEELQAAGFRFTTTLPMPTLAQIGSAAAFIRQLVFPNLTQAMEFAQLFDPGSHADVWLGGDRRELELFDTPVTLNVNFWVRKRPAIVHGVDDMRDVVAGAEPVFATPQSATAAVKRVMRENSIRSRTVRSIRTADDRYLSAIFMPDGTSDATYSKLAAALTQAGFKTKLHVDTGWVSASASAVVHGKDTPHGALTIHPLGE